MAIEIKIGKLFNLFIGKKQSRISEVFAGQTYGNILGAGKPENYAKYLETYGNEVYVYACTYLIANTIAGLPLKIYKDKIVKGETVKDEQPKHPANALLKRPNSFQMLYDVIESIVANQELTGNSYTLMDELRGEIPRAIYSLDSSRITILPDPKEYIKGYKYMTAKGSNIVFKPEEIEHGKYLKPDDDYYGLSSISAGRISIDTNQRAREQNRRIFVNGAKVDAVLETDAELSDPVFDRLKKDFENRYRGDRNSHKTAILEQGLKYREIGLSQRDLEYIKGQKLNREEICAIFQVPPILVGVMESATYNNISEAQKIFYQFCILPKLVKVANIFTRIVRRFGDPLAYAGFDITEVKALKEDLANTAKIVDTFWKAGVPMNMLVKAFNLPFGTVPNGDKAYIPFNMVEVGSARAEGNETEEEEEEEDEDERTIKKIAWTDEKKEAKWKAFVNTTEAFEKKYQKALAPYFKEQEKQVLAQLDKFKQLGVRQIDEKMIVIYSIETMDGKKRKVKVAVNADKVTFAFEKERKRLLKVSTPNHKAALLATAKQEAELLDLDIELSMESSETRAFIDEVEKWLKKYGLKAATEVLDTVRDDIKKQLVLGLKEGEGVPELKKRIKGVYDGYRTPEAYKIVRIARTEIIASSNQGALEVYKEAKVEKKGWLAALDERTRDSHIRADRVYKDGIPIKEDFQLDFGSGSAPGQIDAVEENVNCRCTIFPIIE